MSEVMRRDRHGTSAVTQIIARLGKFDGGPSYSVPSLNEALKAMGVCANVRCVAQAGRDLATAEASLTIDAIEHPANRGPSIIMRGSSALRDALHDDASHGAVLHAHGLWLLPNLYPAWIKRQSPSVLIVHSPRGMLGPAALEISKWKKRLVWGLWQKSALRMADCIHATALSEYEEIRALGLDNPVAVIPNGIDIRPLEEGRGVGRESSAQKTILSLGRLHPKKGLDALVRAWATLEQAFPDWRVRIVGPSEGGHEEDLRRLAQMLGLERLTIEGPVYDNDKFAIYRDASLFVLPTRNENFGLVVAEALAARVPVISTKGAPWSGLESERCGWWVDQGAAALASAMAKAMSTEPAVRAEMGRRGRAWMRRDFAWERVATDMSAVYAWLRKEGPMPSTVRLD